MNSVVHFEIPADNVERAQNFYSEAFDWKIEPVPEMDYTILQTTELDEKRMPKEPGTINGGMMKRSGEFKSPIITIETEDIEAALEKVEEAGGETLKTKMPVGDMGFAAYFKDTEGNIIGLWQNKM